jgi:hypothetical protein
MGTPTPPSMSPITRSTSPCEFINNKSGSRCSGAHFPIRIREDTKKDHERCITFLWNPNGLFVQTRDNSRWNDNGRRPFNKLKLDDFPKAPKEKSNQNEDGQWLFGDKSRCLLEFLFSIPSRRSLKSFFEVVTSLSTIVTSFGSSTIS